MTKNEEKIESMSVDENTNEYIETLSKEADTVEADLAGILEELQAEKEKFHKQFMLSEADLKNVKRRAEIDVANAHKFALEKFVKELLPIVDAMELEIAAITEDNSENLQKFKQGSMLTHKMLLTALEKFGVKQLHPIGEKLNPEFHQAITMQKNPEFESNHIVQVVQNGYLLNERLIRAAQVIVAE